MKEAERINWPEVRDVSTSAANLLSLKKYFEELSRSPTGHAAGPPSRQELLLQELFAKAIEHLETMSK